MATRAPKGLRILGWILRTLGTLIVFGVAGVMVWRLASSGDPSGVKSLLPNEPLCAAYETYGNDLILRYQDQYGITRAEHNAGYFSVTRYASSRSTTTRTKKSAGQKALEKTLNTTATTIGRGIGNKIVRSILGSIFK